MEQKIRERGTTVPNILTIRGYSLTPFTLFGGFIAAVLLYLSRLMGPSPGFVFIVFGIVACAVVIQRLRNTKSA